MKLLRSPLSLNSDAIVSPCVFLAGSIEQGKAKDWYPLVQNQLQNEPGILLSPRRENWDPTWVQHPSNKPFREQVDWELQGILEKSDIVFFYFQEQTLSPISLLELGIVLAAKKPVIVACEPEFWRRGNIHITAEYFGIPVYDSLGQGIDALKTKLHSLA